MRPTLLLVSLGCACTFDGVGLGSEGGATTSAGSTASGGESTAATTTSATTDGSATEATTMTTTMTTTSASTSASTDATTAATTAATTTTEATTTGDPMCGDGVLGPGEECDNGEMNGDGESCKGDCTSNVCGDGAQGPGEGCDDGNLTPGDGCSGACVLETCGDGIIDDGEGCDDGNTEDDDECTNACNLPACGDMIVQKSNGEECDDGPANGATAPCTALCLGNVCGDGFALAGVEGCDDGNKLNTDGCTTACKPAACGDGFVQEGVEECDDGNADEMDACSNACKSQGTRVFVTAGVFKGDLGGLSGAHGVCQAAADTAGIGGTWKAWLAIGIGEAPSDFFVQSTAPYVRLDGVIVANNWGDLTDGSIAAKIEITENKAMAGDTNEVWTNVNADGTATDILLHCLGWTNGTGGVQSRAGLRGNTDAKWTDSGGGPKGCSGARHLYCFEQ